MRFDLRRAFILGFCTLVVFTVISCKSSRKNENSKGALKPINVVLITLDTVRADHLHSYGDKNVQTPTVDGLAQRGVLFEKAVAQTPLTEPSHASIFTGTNPNVHGVRNTGGFALQPSSITLATILRRHGWDTAAFVSASVLKKVFGFSQGFTTYDDQMPSTTSGQDVAARPANITVDHAIDWLNAQRNRRFFLWVHLYDAHQPYDPPPQFRKEYPGNPYDAEIAFEDQQLGRLLKEVYKKSPISKTIIVLLSDHGESLGQHGEYEHGVFLYDSTVRIAWIMAGPGIPHGVRIQQQAREIDVLPTVLDLLGGKASAVVQGTSMLPAFFGKTVPSTYSYEETLCPKINFGWAELRGIHTAHWMYARAPSPELYDLDTDPGELNNVIDAHPKEYRRLEEQLKIASRLGKSGAETVVASQMDQMTMNQLESLGYVSGFSKRNIELNGSGDNPKDHLATLKTLEIAMGPDSSQVPAVRKIELLRTALKEDPKDPSIYYALSEQYERTGQYDQGLQVCLAALHHGIRNAMILARLGQLYLREGNQAEAIRFYEEAAQLNPLDGQAQSNLATAYLQKGRLADAERVYRWVLTTQPYVPAYNGLGLIAIRRNDLTDARKNFDRAVQIDPGYVEAQMNLGILCTRTQDIPCARAAFQAFLAKAPQRIYGNVIPQVKDALARMGS